MSSSSPRHVIVASAGGRTRVVDGSVEPQPSALRPDKAGEMYLGTQDFRTQSNFTAEELKALRIQKEMVRAGPGAGQPESPPAGSTPSKRKSRKSGSLPARMKAKEKTELCSHFLSSSGTHCPHGAACNFAHGVAELRRLPAANPPPASALPPSSLPPPPRMLAPVRTSQLLPPESAGHALVLDPRSPSNTEGAAGGTVSSDDGSWSAGSGQAGSAFSLFSSRVSWVGGLGSDATGAASPRATRWEEIPTSPTLQPPPGFEFLRPVKTAPPIFAPEFDAAEVSANNAVLREPPAAEELNKLQSRLLFTRLADPEQPPQQPELPDSIVAARAAARAALQRPSPTPCPPWW